ncbi:MAG: hypothetical protein Q4F23_01600 [Coriobacteriia bacterium]|nr:hypothetical protein [Coriobacteriia bacterium]
MGFFSSIFGGKEPLSTTTARQITGSQPDNEVNLDPVRSLIELKTIFLKSGLAGKSDFYQGWGDQPEIQESFRAALDYKRRGDLVNANEHFFDCFLRAETLNSEFVWSWCKVMILAKNWECLRDLLEYHFDMMVVWNRLMRQDDDRQFFATYSAFNMIPHFEFDEFHAGEHLRDQVHHPLMDRSESIDRLCQFGGSPYWQACYDISEKEWEEFQRIFPIPEL